MKHSPWLALPIVGMSVLAAPALAHHALQSQFDIHKPITFQGVLKKVEWTNPHVYFYFDVTDETGKVTEWAVETVGPGGLRRAGLSRAGFFKVGDTYTVNGIASRDGSSSAFLNDFKFPDGKIVRVWFGDPNGK
jgi:hypothetical protein